MPTICLQTSILIIVNDQVPAPDEIEGVLADLHGHRRPDGFLPLFEKVMGGLAGLVTMLSMRSVDTSSGMMMVVVVLLEGGQAQNHGAHKKNRNTHCNVLDAGIDVADAGRRCYHKCKIKVLFSFQFEDSRHSGRRGAIMISVDDNPLGIAAELLVAFALLHAVACERDGR